MKKFDFKNAIKIDELRIAAKTLKAGGLVVFPTETVYGIGANALDNKAVDTIFKAKGRANDNPLIVHIADFEMLDFLVEEPNSIEKKLIDAFMPGPFTLVLKKKAIIPNNVSANLDTVGIRIPDNKIAYMLIKEAGVPVAAPSANKSSKPSGTNITDIEDDFHNLVDIIIDGGETKIGIESTVCKVIDGIPTILRPGKVTDKDILDVIGNVKIDEHVFIKTDGIVESPGMKYKHYAPVANTLLIFNEKESEQIKIINNHIIENTVVIGFSEHKNLINCFKFLDLGSINDLDTISHNMFAFLRKADRLKPNLIIIEGVPKEGLGIAIMNRLIRASNYNYIEK